MPTVEELEGSYKLTDESLSFLDKNAKWECLPPPATCRVVLGADGSLLMRDFPKLLNPYGGAFGRNDMIFSYKTATGQWKLSNRHSIVLRKNAEGLATFCEIKQKTPPHKLSFALGGRGDGGLLFEKETGPPEK
jgi:hypothetical protein